MVLKNKMHGENSEMMDLALRVCRGYLNGPWKKITANDISVKRISGGLSNWLYQVSFTKPLVKPAEPSQVLLRLYGQTHGERALESLITDSVIFTLLSERNLGPKLHGIFPGGRIEEYIPARPLRTLELADDKLSRQIATKMAAVHAMNVPINKEPRWLWDTTNRWLQNIDEGQMKENQVDESPIAEVLYKLDLKREVSWLKEHLIKLKSPVVFCHNDMQEGNILLREDLEDPTIVLIDFEYCSYNYRGFDIANHFIEWIYDYTEAEHPNFRVVKENYPSRDQMLVFLEQYAHSVPGQHAPVCLDTLIREVRNFTLASHLFWGLWGMVNAKRSQIPFGYWEYAKERIDSYFQLKAELVGCDSGIKRKAVDLE
ncbi:choline/ethanolamine kinase isoform X2 [Macrosteles quadrilineatus]|uniref:choline/ethanolamine kinase isoform X2 n=1 Tax=Macrosteles quadrilineatus TaxID=74068 RepID=UPI0023E2D7F9|nr:choline/ethanolamine kinase isoform X2 [Macrosteles quadrilineatus]